MSQPEKPLLTFAVVAYNQERFIREAVEGALSQTYSLLQVILSDDCSPDRTYEIMEEMARSYQGPHQVVLNRNPKNLGMGGHVNRIVDLARGELIVVAAGDDVSLPERTAVLHDAWERSGRQAMVLQSRYILIDEDGHPREVDEDGKRIPPIPLLRQDAPSITDLGRGTGLLQYVETLDVPMSGATFAWNPVLFSLFGPLPDQLVHEDNAVVLRALVAGRFQRVEAPLIRRRLHSTNVFFRESRRVSDPQEIEREEQRERIGAWRRVVLYDAFLADLQVALEKNLITSSEAQRAKAACLAQQRIHRLLWEYGAASFWCKVGIFCSLLAVGAPRGSLRHLSVRLLPFRVFRAVKGGVNSLRRRPPTKRE